MIDYSLAPHQRLYVSAFVVVDSSNKAPENGSGKAKYLGESIIELSSLTEKLTNIPEHPIIEDVELCRKVNDQNAIVGKVTLQMRLRYDIVQPRDIDKVISNDEMHLLPEMNFIRSFIWRLRIHVRSGVNLPSQGNDVASLPSAYIEGAWTLYVDDMIDNADVVRSPCVEKTKHPIWNTELLYYPPSKVSTICGFFHIILKDRYQVVPLQKFSFPLSCLKPFHPVNLDFKLAVNYGPNEVELLEKDRSHLYMSITLEDAPVYKLSESYVNLLMTSVNIDPLPKCTDRVSIVMTTNKIKPPNNLYTSVDLQDPNHIIQILEYLKTSIPYSCFISNTITLPPKRINNQYNALSNFIIPRNLLDRDLSFFIYCRDLKVLSNHSMPNILSGEITTSLDMIKSSFFSKHHESVPFKLLWYNEGTLYGMLSFSKGVVGISARPIEDEVEKEDKPYHDIDDINYMDLKQKMLNGSFAKANEPGNQRVDVISKELIQKQELLQRMMKDVDDKTESLKLSGAEIVELRKQIKLLQSENTILRKSLGQEEQMQVEALVTQEIHTMSLPELKSKIVRLAQAYRGERMRNEEFEKALKQAQNEISNARKTANELEQLHKAHEDNEVKFIALQKETQKIGLYRETIKKQEEVIVKMEGLLKKTMNESERQKECLMEMDVLKMENTKLQRELKDYVVTNDVTVIGKGNAELEKARAELKRLQLLASELRNDLRSKRPMTGERKELQSEMLQMEVKCHKADARIKTLEEELEINAKNYAKEISALKLILAEKQALIETMRMETAV